VVLPKNSGIVPTFFTVTDCGALDVPINCVENVRVEGVIEMLVGKNS
jgi:hypothetical protein